MKKKYFKYTIILIGILGLYYVASDILMNGQTRMIHYFSYDNIEDARRKGGIINEDVKYVLIGFDPKIKEMIDQNLKIWTTKSLYQEFYGIIYFVHEDEYRLRIHIDEKNNIPIYYTSLFYKNKPVGSISYSSFDVLRDNDSITLVVKKPINRKLEKIGEIIIYLK